MEVSGQFHAPAGLPLRKESQYPLDWRLSGLQSWSECGSEENPSPYQELNPSHIAHRPGQ